MGAMRLIPLVGGKPDLYVSRLGKDVHVVLWDDHGALGATLLADDGSISVSASRAAFRKFLKEMPVLDDWSVKAVHSELRKWLGRSRRTRA